MPRPGCPERRSGRSRLGKPVCVSSPTRPFASLSGRLWIASSSLLPNWVSGRLPATMQVKSPRRAAVLIGLVLGKEGLGPWQKAEPSEPSCSSGMADDLQILPFVSAAEMEEWLEGNHAGSDGIWLKIGKKGSGIASITYAEALELALC